MRTNELAVQRNWHQRWTTDRAAADLVNGVASSLADTAVAIAAPAVQAPVIHSTAQKPVTAQVSALVAEERALAPKALELSPEQKLKAAEVSKVLMTAFGQIISILMRSEQHKHLPLADLEWLAMPAVTTGQFLLAEAQLKGSGMMAPVGLVLWASVSPEVNERLEADRTGLPRLKPEEWKSGAILWVIEAIGEGKMIQAMLKRKMDQDWKGRPVKMRVRDKAGVMRVGMLGTADDYRPMV
jgi:hemolysin-activating ACP:hemolysin acyltransferase